MSNICQPLKETYEEMIKAQHAFDELLNNNEEENNQKLEKVKKLEKVLAEKVKAFEQILIDSMEETMGGQFLGPKLIKETFGIELKEIPPIPFPIEVLNKSLKEGAQLILMCGNGLTMKQMYEKRNKKAKDGIEKLLYDTNWYKNEPFFKDYPINLEWKLVSKELTPNTTSKNYLEQTETLIEHIKDSYTSLSIPIPKEYTEAIKEFENNKSRLKALLKFGWQTAAPEIENLKITLLTRETPAEVLYRLILNETNTGEKSLKSKYTWTSKRLSSGKFVFVGFFNSMGVDIRRDRPGDPGSGLGVCLSRRI